MNEDLEMLWETQDFALNKVAILEDEYEFLLQELKRFCAQSFRDAMAEIEGGENSVPVSEKLDMYRALGVSEDGDLGDQVDSIQLLGQFTQISKDLESYYNKQLSSIHDLEIYYHEHPYDIPEEREVSVEAFTELVEVTALLRDAMLNSTNDVKKILTSDGI